MATKPSGASAVQDRTHFDGSPPQGAPTELIKLWGVLQALPSLVVAVSGGVDSLTLMTVAHRAAAGRVRAAHAVSAAVPAAATERVVSLAARGDWALELVDARELHDPDYLRNPVDRCRFCKSRLYSALTVLARRWKGLIVSGTNLDDLGEYRPGLEAARDFQVRHPFVEAGLDKTAVRTIARAMDLGDYAELPASPCLSSRVETGVAISAPVLRLIDRVEDLVRTRLAEGVVRCRVRAELCEIELGPDAYPRLDPMTEAELRASIAAALREHGMDHPVVFAPYRKASAFVGIPV